MIKINAGARLIEAAKADEAAALKYIKSMAGVVPKAGERPESENGAFGFLLAADDDIVVLRNLYHQFGKARKKLSKGIKSFIWTVDKGRTIVLQYSPDGTNSWITLLDSN